MSVTILPKALLCIIVCSGLTNCANTVDFDFSDAQKSQFTDDLLSLHGTSPSSLPGTPLFLSDELKSLLSVRIDASWASRHKLRELRKLLFSETEWGITFALSNTKTAMETYESRNGNCLSLINLFVASARFVGLDASFQTVEVKPSWNHTDGTMIRYEHIVATVQVSGGDRYVLDFLPEFVLGDYNSAPIADEIALALYYNNLGAESLVGDDTAGAIYYLKKALSLNENSTHAWGNLGAAVKRAGRFDLAEYIYSKALQHDSQNYSALSNLVGLYLFQGRAKEAEMISARVERYRNRNPYYHFFQGKLLLEKGKYEQALPLLRRSVRLKENESDFYSALSQTYAALGNVAVSEKMADKARAYHKDRLNLEETEMGHRFWTEGVLIKQNPKKRSR